MTDEQIITLLKVIRSLALLEYPYPDETSNNPNNPVLIVTLGEIAGLITQRIREFDSPPSSLEEP